MPEGGENSDVDKVPTPRVTKEQKKNKASGMKYQGGDDYYKTEISKGFEIINEIVNENDILTTDTLEGKIFLSFISPSFGVAHTGIDKKLILELSIPELVHDVRPHAP
jgi:hypothetical protein